MEETARQSLTKNRTHIKTYVLKLMGLVGPSDANALRWQCQRMPKQAATEENASSAQAGFSSIEAKPKQPASVA